MEPILFPFCNRMMLVKVLLLTILLYSANAAYKRDPCPDPCRCYEFLGVQSAYCNNTGIQSVPQGIPEDTQLLDLSANPIPFIKVGAIKNLPNYNTLSLTTWGTMKTVLN